jgi:hypothetical protein
MPKTQSNRGGGNRGRGSNRSDGSFINTMREKPYAAAAAAAGVAAAGAFLWSKRSQIGEAIDSGMDSLSEMKAQRFGSGEERSQAEISEEALTIKETGRKSKGPRGPLAQQDIKAGIVESNQEAKAGAKAYS